MSTTTTSIYQKLFKRYYEELCANLEEWENPNEFYNSFSYEDFQCDYQLVRVELLLRYSPGGETMQGLFLEEIELEESCYYIDVDCEGIFQPQEMGEELIRLLRELCDRDTWVGILNRLHAWGEASYRGFSQRDYISIEAMFDVLNGVVVIGSCSDLFAGQEWRPDSTGLPRPVSDPVPHWE